MRRWLSLIGGTLMLAGIYLGVSGQALVAPVAPPTRWSCPLNAVTVTTECRAAVAGLRNYVTSVHVSNQAATVQTLTVIFGTGVNCAAGPTALTHAIQLGTVATTTSPIAPSLTFPTPLAPATAGTAICVQPSAATAFGATITGYTAP